MSEFLKTSEIIRRVSIETQEPEGEIAKDMLGDGFKYLKPGEVCPTSVLKAKNRFQKRAALVHRVKDLRNWNSPRTIQTAGLSERLLEVAGVKRLNEEEYVGYVEDGSLGEIFFWGSKGSGYVKLP